MDWTRRNRRQSMGKLLAESSEQRHGRISDGESLPILHPTRGNTARRIRRIQIPLAERPRPASDDAARTLGSPAIGLRPANQFHNTGSTFLLAQRLETAKALAFAVQFRVAGM